MLISSNYYEMIGHHTNLILKFEKSWEIDHWSDGVRCGEHDRSTPHLPLHPRPPPSPPPYSPALSFPSSFSPSATLNNVKPTTHWRKVLSPHRNPGICFDRTKTLVWPRRHQHGNNYNGDEDTTGTSTPTTDQVPTYAQSPPPVDPPL
jgi:hypothetical protein